MYIAICAFTKKSNGFMHVKHRTFITNTPQLRV